MSTSQHTRIDTGARTVWIPDAPAPVRVLGFLLAATVVGIAASLLLARTGYDAFPASLQARRHAVVSGRRATITRILARDGTLVTPGTPLVELRDTGLEKRAAELEAESVRLEAELAQLQARADLEIAVRRQQLERQIFDTRLRLAGYQSLAQLSRPSRPEWTLPEDPVLLLPGAPSFLDGLRQETEPPLFPAVIQPIHFIPVPDSLQAAPRTNPVYAAQIALCEDHLSGLQLRLDRLADQVHTAVGVQVAATRLETVQAQLAALRSEATELTLTAPVHGIVGLYRQGVGDELDPDEAIVELLDEELPHVVMTIPSRRLAEIQAGDVVELRFPGHKASEGEIESIPPQVEPADAGIGSTEPVVSVVVSPAGRIWPRLPFGTRVEVRVRR